LGFVQLKGTFHLLNTKKNDLASRKMLEDFAQPVIFYRYLKYSSVVLFQIWQLIISRKWLENPKLFHFYALPFSIG
jgi:hypothetical protein